jgi:hypothetical protein
MNWYFTPEGAFFDALRLAAPRPDFVKVTTSDVMAVPFLFENVAVIRTLKVSSLIDV